MTKGGSTFAMSGQTEHISPALQWVKRNPALVKSGHVWHFTLALFHPSPIQACVRRGLPTAQQLSCAKKKVKNI